VIVALSVVASFNAGGRVDASDSMTCGSGVELCGLLTLESGFGSGNYDHDECVVHGLWPEVSPYGSVRIDVIFHHRTTPITPPLTTITNPPYQPKNLGVHRPVFIQRRPGGCVLVL